MIAAIQDLAREPNQEASWKTAAYLDASNLLFEQGFSAGGGSTTETTQFWPI